ncbi:MAG: CcmD family protein [Chitinophagaceae bacterium]
MINKFSALWAMLLIPFLSLKAQPATMADAMRSDGKIYVVVAVILIILIGLILYVIRLDKKISKLEK